MYLEGGGRGQGRGHGQCGGQEGLGASKLGVTIQQIVAGLGLSRLWVECLACSEVLVSR